MRNRTPAAALAGQHGFSMIEMLMTAFILAIGLLGLCMLQTMSLRAARGSRSLTSAVQVASGIMDQVEMEGRLSWLNATATTSNAPALNNLTSLLYIKNPTPGPITTTYDGNGTWIDPNAANPPPKVFTATVTQAAVLGSVTGQMSDVTVVVTFADAVSSGVAATPVTRTVTLTRRITHG